MSSNLPTAFHAAAGTTVGGFVGAGEQIMQVVPVGEKLLVEARVAPKDIAFIKVGDKANVKVTAYDFATYGGLSGEVLQVSADSVYDEVEREAYYRVLIETDPIEVDVISDLGSETPNLSNLAPMKPPLPAPSSVFFLPV